MAELATRSLAEIRERIDALDRDLVRLIDERTQLAHDVGAAKRAAGQGDQLGLKPAREAAVLRRILAQPRRAASRGLIVRIWREMIGESLALQGPFQLAVWGGRDMASTLDMARRRFGVAPPVRLMEQANEALNAAKSLGGVAVLSLTGGTPWWGRLLAEPRLRVFAALPCLAGWGTINSLAVADVEVQPTGEDQTFWVTDAPEPASALTATLGYDGIAAECLADAGGLKLFRLAGFYQPFDQRLERAPGRLTGVIGAAPTPVDVDET